MAFTNYGAGNWFRLPEFGITEALGGNQSSLYTNTGIPSSGGGTSSWGDEGSTIPSGSTTTSSSGGIYTAPSSGGSTYAAPNTEGMTEEEAARAAYEAQINEYYGESMDRLNSQESALKGSEQDYYNIATTPYSSQVPLVQQAGQEGQNAILTQQNTAGVQEQNALAAARRLYDELTSRNRQAFGSGALGSVGQAAGEVLGRSTQQGFGAIRNAAGETMQKLYTAATDLKTKTDAQLNSLELQKQQALSQAKLSFKERLDMINQQKELVGQAKAEAKLDALREYRDYTRNLADQAAQLRQQIALTAQANGQDIATAIKQYETGMAGTVQGGQQNVYNQGVSNTNSQIALGQGNVLSSANPQSALEAQGVYGGQYQAPTKKNPWEINPVKSTSSLFA